MSFDEPIRVHRRVMIVARDGEAAKPTARVLSHPLVRVEAAPAPDQAVATARRVKPHLVLIDIGLTEREDFNVLRDLRRHPELRLVRLMLVNPETDLDLRSRVLKALGLAEARVRADRPLDE